MLINCRATRGWSIFVVLIASALLLLQCTSAAKTLVLLEDLKLKDTHSKFFTTLEQRGHTLDLKAADDPELELRQWEDWLYDNVIVLASSTQGFGGSIDIPLLLEFVDDGHNLLLAVDARVSDELRELASECGIELEPKGVAAVDHFDYVEAEEIDHTLIAADGFSSNFPLSAQAPVLFRGIGMYVPPDAELATKVLSAPSTTISHAPTKPLRESPTLAGSELALVTAVQARNNARVVVAGSIRMFGNAYMESPVKTMQGRSSPKSGNEEFAAKMTQWVFNEWGVLRVKDMRHHMVNSTEEQTVYRVNDEVDFEIEIEELKSGEWVPYRAKDVQVELVMLDPHIRQTLVPNNQGCLTARLKLPDVYGVFKFVVDYKRPGYTFIHLEKTVPIRPFKHNEFERFLVAAYPYYGSVLSSMLAFFVFGFFYLYHM